jgi:hypothetical protein
MIRTDHAVRRLMLISERRDTVAPRDATAAKVRRYRLARLQLNERTPAARSQRLAQLKRLYD